MIRNADHDDNMKSWLAIVGTNFKDFTDIWDQEAFKETRVISMKNHDKQIEHYEALQVMMEEHIRALKQHQRQIYLNYTLQQWKLKCLL